MKTANDHALGALFARVGGVLAYLPGIEKCAAFRKVVSAYLAGKYPPWFEFQWSSGRLDCEDASVSCCYGLILCLYGLRLRAVSFEGGDSSAGADWDRYWRREYDYWCEKRSELARLLRNAAVLFESGQRAAGAFPSVAEYKALCERCGQGGVDEIYWPGVENLRRWATVIESTPIEVVFPVARPQPAGWRAVDRGGTQGRASDPAGAFRALAVRSIAEYLPPLGLFKEKFSAVSELAGFIGIEATRQNVRSILMRGRT